MSVEFPCDVLVVGAGPAGSCAAAVTAGEGMRTVLIDAKVRIGEQPHCGEFVPERLFVEFELPRASVIHRVDSMETRITEISTDETGAGGLEAAAGEALNKVATSNLECAGETFLSKKVCSLPPSGKFISFSQVRTRHRRDLTCEQSIEVFGEGCGEALFTKRVSPQITVTDSPGFLIDRVRFDRDLARDAAAAGATVLCSTRLLRKENRDWIARSGRQEIRFNPRFIIAADGAISSVARGLGMGQPEVLRGLQIEAPFAGASDRTYIFLDRSFVGGYGWVFPKGRTANVGVGLVPQRDLNGEQVAARFLDRLCRIGMIRPGRLARSGGLIPVSGIRDSLVVGNAVFCGDAAGLTHPITGAGIPQAVFSGRQAGRAVASAIKSSRSQPLADYEAEIKGRYSGVIDHALKKRRVMMDSWDEPDFSKVCERTWIAFKGYRIRERFK